MPRAWRVWWMATSRNSTMASSLREGGAGWGVKRRGALFRRIRPRRAGGGGEGARTSGPPDFGRHQPAVAVPCRDRPSTGATPLVARRGECRGGRRHTRGGRQRFGFTTMKCRRRFLQSHQNPGARLVPHPPSLRLTRPRTGHNCRSDTRRYARGTLRGARASPLSERNTRVRSGSIAPTATPRCQF